MKLSLLMVLVAVLAQVQSQSCGQSAELRGMARSLGRIVGGQEVGSCSVIPWQVRLTIEKGGTEYLCGGSIISDRHVLTAAHCLVGVRSASQVQAYFGDYDQYASEEHDQQIDVKSFISHPDFVHQTHDSDIAVLTLKKAIERNDCTKLVCLDESHHFNGHTCIVSGWGQTSSGLNAFKLKMLKAKTYDGPNCVREFNMIKNNYMNYPQKTICAGLKEGGEDACQGDSGGPLVCWDGQSFLQVGVVSNGKGCALKNNPTIYTRVSYFRRWIYQMMRQYP